MPLAPNLSKQNIKQLIDLGDLVTTKVTPPAPATPPLPDLAAKLPTILTPKLTTARAANKAYDDAQLALKTLKAARDQARDELLSAHRQMVSLGEGEAGDDPVKLASIGYAVAGAPVAVTDPPDQILNLNVTMGDNAGSVDCTCDPDDKAKTLEWQATTVDPLAGPWITKKQTTISSATLDGFTSGQRIWVRVRGIGIRGEGPWSDVATKIVP